MIPLYKLPLADAIVRTLRKRPATLDGIDARLRFHQHDLKSLNDELLALIKEGKLRVTDGTFFVAGPAPEFGSQEYTFKDAVGHDVKRPPKPLRGQTRHA